MSTYTRNGSETLTDESGRVVNLNDLMEFEHVIKVHDDGTVTEPQGVYAPEVDSDGEVMGNWNLLNGYTGQYGYSGPVMHPSEVLSGRIASDILDTPGLYVVVEVRDAETLEFPDEPIGWAVATRVV